MRGGVPLRIDRDVARALLNGDPRLTPPDEVGEEEVARTVPGQPLGEWIRQTFIEATGMLSNEDHGHLLDAQIGVLWTNIINVSKMRQVLATAEIPQTMGGAWKRGRAEQQLRDWFACEPDFVLTFYAPEVGALDERSICALVEHELYHCAQALDRYGVPKFDRFGAPMFAIRGHDVEEFTAVVERYGATTPELRRMVKAANARPGITDEPIQLACGTCARGMRAA